MTLTHTPLHTEYAYKWYRDPCTPYPRGMTLSHTPLFRIHTEYACKWYVSYTQLSHNPMHDSLNRGASWGPLAQLDSAIEYTYVLMRLDMLSISRAV